MPKQNDAETQKLRENILPIVRYAAKHKGFVGRLAERLASRCEVKPPSRQMVWEWLNPTESERVQPRLGIGLVLIEEANKLMRRNGG